MEEFGHTLRSVTTEERSLLRDLAPQRVYFGNEFCEHLIPEEDALEQALGSAAERGLRLSLLTPSS